MEFRVLTASTESTSWYTDSRNLIGTLVLSAGALLGVIGWFVSFISQCVAESRNHLRLHHVWFTTWVNLALVIAIVFLIIVGSVGFFKPLLVPFLIIAIVMSVLGADLGLYSNRGDMQAMGAGYLIFAVAAVIWLLYLTYAESTESAVTGGKPTGGSFGSVPGVGSGLSGLAGTAGGAGAGAAAGGMASAGSGASGALGGLRNRFSLGKNAPGKGSGMDAMGGPNNAPMNGAGPSQNMGVPTGVVAHSPTMAESSAPMRGVDNSVIPESSQVPGSHLAGAGAPSGLADAPRPDASLAQEPGVSSTYPPQYGGDSSLAPPIVGGDPSTYGANVSQGAPSGLDAPDSAAPQEQGGSRLQRAEALYSYKASEDDPTEISFNKGDILEIVDSSGKWWQAYRPNGELGIVPSNYLQML